MSIGYEYYIYQVNAGGLEDMLYYDEEAHEHTREQILEKFDNIVARNPQGHYRLYGILRPQNTKSLIKEYSTPQQKESEHE